MGVLSVPPKGVCEVEKPKVLAIPPSYVERRHVEKPTVAITWFGQNEEREGVGEMDSWATAGQSKRQREPEMAVATGRMGWWL